MYNTLEDHIDAIVEKKLKEILPKMIEELKLDLEARQHQVLFNQKELAKKLGVSSATVYKWRTLGLESEANPTGGLLFDIMKVNKWREENNKRKIR